MSNRDELMRWKKRPLSTIADIGLPADDISMVTQVHVYEFPETAFVVGSDPVVCAAPVAMIRSFLTVAEIDRAFSGYASFRQTPWMTRYVGVWGRKNCQRLRRFLRERGADVVLHRERPEGLRLASYKTQGERKKVRLLSQLSA